VLPPLTSILPEAEPPGVVTIAAEAVETKPTIAAKMHVVALIIDILFFFIGIFIEDKIVTTKQH